MLLSGKKLVSYKKTFLISQSTQVWQIPAHFQIIKGPSLSMRYKRQAIRDVGKFKEVLRDRPSHSDGGKRQ